MRRVPTIDWCSERWSLVQPGTAEEGRLLGRYCATCYYATGDYEKARDAYQRHWPPPQEQSDAAMELTVLSEFIAVDHHELHQREVIEAGQRGSALAKKMGDNAPWDAYPVLISALELGDISLAASQAAVLEAALTG